MTGMQRRHEPFSWLLSGSAVVSIYDVEIPVSVTISERERAFQQPFNEFGIRPRWKSITLHAGYSSIPWSRYTNAGVRFLGAGIEIQPDFLYISALYGRLQRAVDEDPTNRYAIPAYRRMGGGAKCELSAGWLRGGISLFYAQDDTTSLSHAPPGVLPMENATVGLNLVIGANEKMTMDVEIAGSLLTRDLRSPSIHAGGFSSDVQYEYLKELEPYFNLRTSSSLAFAGRGGLTFTLPHMGLRLGYEVIEPDYTSLGAYFFNTDVRNFTVAPSFRLFSGKMRVSGSLGVQSDNVGGNKTATTSRMITSANVGWTSDVAWGIDARVSNFSTSQVAERGLINDSIRVRNVNSMISITPRAVLESDILRHMFLLTASFMQYDDLNAFTSQFTESTTLMTSFSYTLATKKSPLSGSTFLTYSNTQNAIGDTRILGINISASSRVFNDALQLSLSVGYSHMHNGTFGIARTLTETARLSYALSRIDRIGLALYASQNDGETQLHPSFREMTATLDYSHSLDWTMGAGARGVPPL